MLIIHSDVEITRRKRYWTVSNASGEVLTRAQYFDDILLFLDAEEVNQARIVSPRFRALITNLRRRKPEEVD